MHQKKVITILSLCVLAVAAIAIAAAFGVVAYRSASAAAPNSSELSAASVGFAHMGKGIGGQAINEFLADALGISVDELKAAYQEANEAALKQAVEQELITQAQADDLLAKGFAFPFGGRWGGWLSQKGIDYHALLAEALGISVEELQAACVQALSARIDQAVANGNLSQEKADLMKARLALHADENFQHAMQSAYEAAVAQAVSDGVITQAQADLILQNANNKRFGQFFGIGGMRGFDGGHGRGPHGMWGGDNSSIPEVPLEP